jgi:hypothetical protein
VDLKNLLHLNQNQSAGGKEKIIVFQVYYCVCMLLPGLFQELQGLR